MVIFGYQQIQKKFLYIVKWFKMALVEKNKPQQVNSEELTKEEYEFLFNILKNTDFKGYQVEILYNTIVKLQKNYLKNNQ